MGFVELMNRLARRLYMGLAAFGVLGFCVSPGAGALAQWAPVTSDAENQAIAYSTTESSDAVASLQRAINSGTVALQFEAQGGYLASVLKVLRVPVESQVLAFSKTSLQRALISPGRPRAVYFNQDVHVAWVPGGAVLEIAAMDAKLGAVFYTLRQQATARPTFRRQTQACLQCHDSPSFTSGVPGLILNSVHPDEDGEPIASAGTLVTSDQSPLEERWGGWYVTGTHGTQLHMGNLIAGHSPHGGHLNRAAGANLTDLSTRINTQPYLSAHSDIVALMVLGHQSRVHNLMTRASYGARMALYFDQMRNKELGRSAEYVPDSTRSLIGRLAEPLVRTMLFVDEAPLTEPVSGTSGFSKEFSRRGPRDQSGRSLLELDLTRRLFKYPCSYVIYSASFDALPSLVKNYVYRRLWAILSDNDTSAAFAHLSSSNRTAIMEILLETKPDFAAWRMMRASQ